MAKKLANVGVNANANANANINNNMTAVVFVAIMGALFESTHLITNCPLLLVAFVSHLSLFISQGLFHYR